ncbi:MAG: chitobiase/beta-hexosaminidase C-terminal domain-containing protein, partial [Phycisphaerales bacterium]|nr:chitobiase/beta-hexosaminidase C-terminal domain-containing protein [Phycisphaerales bacterium]
HSFPFDARRKTLLHGWLPAPQWSIRRGGVEYRFLVWGAPANLDPREDLIAYVQVDITNPGDIPARAGLRATFTPIEGDARRWPCVDWYRERFMAPGKSSLRSGDFRFDEGVMYCDSHAVLVGDATRGTSEAPGAVEYTFDLEPVSGRRLVFRIPYVPIASQHNESVARIVMEDVEERFRDVVQYWYDDLSGAMRVDLPEDKVVETLQTSLAYILIARDVDETGKGFVQKVNEFQYDHFYPRDSAYLARVLNMWGLHGVAEGNLESFLVRDAGGAITRIHRYPHHPDDWGQSLWALGAHVRANADADLARRLTAAISLHLDDFERSVKGDPLGLWPVAAPYDNELINGHYTGHNFWALLGLREAEYMARQAGDDALASRARALHDDFRKVVIRRLEELTSQTEGYIPPGMDDPMAGYDWANASGGVYPFGVLEPNHPWARATTRTAREYKWREGISTYGPNAWALKQRAREGADAAPGYLHHYQTYNVTEALLAMGEQEEVIEDLYAILAHTSSTHAGFEFTILPWDDRDPKGNYPPHGWFAARTCELLRNMLVREVGNELHLASALSPRWLSDGDRVGVENAPTDFGRVSYHLDVTDDGAVLRFRPSWRVAPEKIVFHIPWFIELEEARTDEGVVTSRDGVLELPSHGIELRMKWKRLPHADLSYERAVHLWLEKAYSPRPETDLGFLFPRPTRPKLRNACRVFTDRYSIELLSPNPSARIHYTLDGSQATPASPCYAAPITIEDTSALNAIEVWPDGRTSEPLSIPVRRIPLRAAESADGAEPGLRLLVVRGGFDRLPDYHGHEANAITVRDLSLTATGVEHDYAAVFDGLILIPQEGVYHFSLGSDDGSRLWIGGDMLIDNDGLHPYTEKSGDEALAAGLHLIRVEYFERSGASRLSLAVRGPDGVSVQPGADSFFYKPVKAPSD